MRKLFYSRLDYLLNNIWVIEPCYHSLIEFSISQKEEQSIYSSLSNIGVIDSNEISVEKCLISRDENQKIFKDEEFKFEIISYSKEGNQLKKGGNVNNFKIQIEGELKNGSNKNNDSKIMDLNNGKYEVKLKLKDKGKYSIFVLYDGININSSPFQIQTLSTKIKFYNELNRPKLTFGSNGNKNGQFSYPYRITTDSEGNILVCDFHNNRIQIFTSEGNFLLTQGSKGNGNDQFNGPFGITINSQEDIIVCEYNNNRIQIFDSEGKFLSMFGSKGNGNGQLDGPRGICVNLNDDILVCDYNNHRVQIFDSEGNFISTFGSRGNGNGQFDGPIGITTNSKGDIIVCDYNNRRIQIFNSEGKFISTFGSQGKRFGQFDRPWGICVDLDDNILVCDSGNHRIQIFDSEGEYLTQFEVSQPIDITIDPKTQNVIVSRNDHQISIFFSESQ